MLRPVGGIGETQTQQTDSGGSAGRRNRLDCRLFFREQSERCTVGIERLKATAAAKDEAQAAVRTRQDGDHRGESIQAEPFGGACRRASSFRFGTFCSIRLRF